MNNIFERMFCMIFEKVREIICLQFELDKDSITPETTLDELDADSLDIVDLAMSLEDEFDMEFPEEVVEDFSCVGDIVRYIDEN